MIPLNTAETEFLRIILGGLAEEFIEDNHEHLDVYLNVRFKLLRDTHEHLNELRNRILGISPEVISSKPKICNACNGTRFVTKIHGPATETLKCPECNHHDFSPPGQKPNSQVIPHPRPERMRNIDKVGPEGDSNGSV